MQSQDTSLYTLRMAPGKRRQIARSTRRDGLPVMSDVWMDVLENSDH